MQKKALVIIDIQNDITKNYKEIIENINEAVDWAVNNDIIHKIDYIQFGHNTNIR